MLLGGDVTSCGVPRGGSSNALPGHNFLELVNALEAGLPSSLDLLVDLMRSTRAAAGSISQRSQFRMPGIISLMATLLSAVGAVPGVFDAEVRGQVWWIQEGKDLK